MSRPKRASSERRDAFREGLVRPTSPFADRKRAPEGTWLAPRLLAEVSYSEIMEERLRDPVLRSLRVIR